jgi:hypothetical protein
MGMLMHHTWVEQQKQKPVKAEPVPAPVKEEPKEEPVKEPVKRTGGRRKTTK